MRVMIAAVGFGLLLTGCEAGHSTTARDNTAVNKRDAEGHSVTPMDQSNSQADVDQVAEIRSQVLDIDGLSVNGRNIKIVTNAGKVVLRGPVASAGERDSILAVAENIAGSGNVTSQLEVAP